MDRQRESVIIGDHLWLKIGPAEKTVGRKARPTDGDDASARPEVALHPAPCGLRGLLF